MILPRRADRVLGRQAPDPRQVSRRLRRWFRANGRDLPGRRTRDPYRVLVSEVMLQQTQVDRVVPKYHEWLEKYPTFAALADAADCTLNAAGTVLTIPNGGLPSATTAGSAAGFQGTLVVNPATGLVAADNGHAVTTPFNITV